MDLTWRDYEKLVSKLEKSLFPLGATVKSPDYIKDTVTNINREVDGSIRYKVGTEEILVTIECRNRNNRQCISWIEQLVTKKRSINANKTIAVSVKGFSLAAKELAKKNDIILKTLDEIDPASVLEWLIPNSIVNLFRQISLISLIVTYFDNKMKKITTIKTQNETCLRDNNGFTINILSLMRSAEIYLSNHCPEMLFSPKLDGSSSSILSLSQPLDNNKLYLKIKNKSYRVSHIKLKVKICYLHTITDIESGKNYIYFSDKNCFQVTESESSNSDIPFIFRHMVDINTKEMLHSIELSTKQNKY